MEMQSNNADPAKVDGVVLSWIEGVQGMKRQDDDVCVSKSILTQCVWRSSIFF